MRENYYRHIFDLVPCAIIITDQQGIIVETNSQAASLFGYSHQELLGKTMDTLIPEWFCEQNQKYLDSLNPPSICSQTELNINLLALTKVGQEFPTKISLALLENSDSNKILTTFIDMSEHLNVLEELKRVQKELNDFVAVASHDLKSPIRGITQLCTFIEEELSDLATEKTKNYLSLVINRTTRLEGLLKDLVTYSRINFDFGNTQKIDIKAFVLKIFERQSPAKDVSITFEEKLPILSCYTAPLEVIFTHLIDNAIKHKNEGRLMINVSAQEYPKHYEFSVSDNGPGILERDQERIFDLFTTLKPRDLVEGSGMGLSIIRKLLVYQNCIVSVSSDGENGSCFTFTWPKIT